MKVILETPRLLCRELDYCDQMDLFEMDSDPDVHEYIDKYPIKSMDQIVSVIEGLKTQYRENGIARWAVVDKVSMECVGWSGLKYYREPLNNHLHFYELGYRFKKKHWGKGFATESSSGIVDYGFKNLPIASVFAITHPRNLNSQKVLVKLGFNFVETFDDAGQATHWYELKKTNWEKGIKHPSENT